MPGERGSGYFHLQGELAARPRPQRPLAEVGEHVLIRRWNGSGWIDVPSQRAGSEAAPEDFNWEWVAESLALHNGRLIFDDFT